MRARHSVPEPVRGVRPRLAPATSLSRPPGPPVPAASTSTFQAATVMNILDYKPTIEMIGGLKPASIKGVVELRNVSFAYPARRDRKVAPYPCAPVARCADPKYP